MRNSTKTTRWMILSIALSFWPLAGQSEILDQEKTADAAYYFVTNDYSNSLVEKNSRLDVLISTEVSEKELEGIARKLKAECNPDNERLLITFYLPGMDLGGWAWATAIFRPELEINFVKKTGKIEEESLNLLYSDWETLQGEWVYEYPYANSRIVLSKKGSISYLKELYENGSIAINPVHPSLADNGTRFDFEAGSGEIGYWIVQNDGTLQRFDANGSFGETMEIIREPAIQPELPLTYKSNALSTVYHSNKTIEATIRTLETAIQEEPASIIGLFSPNFLYSIDEKKFLYDLGRSGIRDLSINILYLDVESSRAYCVLSTQYFLKNSKQHNMAVLFLRKIGDDWKLANFPFANTHVPNWPQGFPNW